MKNNEIELLPLFKKFIVESENGKRLKKNGKKLKPETVDNYRYVYTNIQEFVLKNSFRLRLYDKLDKRGRESERNYWKKFYKNFTDFLYNTKKCHDNYVGATIKILRVFFNYLKNEKLLSTGDFHKDFYVTKEELPVITLTYEQLQFLIFDEEFSKSLSKSLLPSLDIFIIGCTVALRVSDIFNLKVKDIEKLGDSYYLQNKSQKTEVVTRVKLPQYAVDIVKKYSKNHNSKEKLFPQLSLNQFNKNIKAIAKQAGWTNPVGKTRTRQGKVNEAYVAQTNSVYRFCDLVSSHIMRRTAVTTMLILGMPEHLVRKVSGHSSNSKAFYRYVNYAQSFLDNEINRVHQKLENRSFQI